MVQHDAKAKMPTRAVNPTRPRRRRVDRSATRDMTEPIAGWNIQRPIDRGVNASDVRFLRCALTFVVSDINPAMHSVEVKRRIAIVFDLDLDLIRIGFVTIVSSSSSYRERCLVCADARVRFMRDGRVSSPSSSCFVSLSNVISKS